MPSLATTASLSTTTRDAAAEAPTNETPPINRRLCESFQRAAAEREERVSPPPPRPQKDLPLPTRLNYIIQMFTVHRSSAPVKTAADPPRTPPDVKAMICSIPVSAHAGVARPSISSPSVAAPAKVFAAAVWSTRVAYLHDFFSSRSIKFPFVHHFGGCGSDYPCRIESCRNARMNVSCTVKCCVWDDVCANRPRECSKVTVMQDAKTSQYGLVATTRVEADEVLGEYLGQLRCVPKNTSLRARNQGYKLRMRARLILEEYVGIDARQLGGRMRFTNHSCSANARLFEFANGHCHTFVVVTTQDISPGDEVTVTYGQDLWLCAGAGVTQPTACTGTSKTRKTCRARVAE
ncbi:hypothetical protein JG687_00013896 [Phytophthora cactorum]|uniref:SET domain-containing protein n=1 Tax=Phytophthora cactorum TaxID=29920 RepID=A0A8T1TY05_9STRA|nr:hypothetical protein PC120_g6322 [Phytophthora cactorum]KAG3060350.1 hypothetical protein PC121_g13512 [Phytophthora cactorum]KAG3177565.1 hypothetical protein PC128_g16807 [Phytophthora cactorum]KAG4061296.1 hypothetical protein PC123_g3795 [Phytophthora cactorum]KAG6951009.1 hypothetical protein JG687_00013896 [Phytophthora cactorum]